MAKILVQEHIHNGEKYHHTQYLYYCEGCKTSHAFGLKSEGGNHDFNMDLNNPTVSPSLVANFSPGTMCHSFIRNGKIEYLNDCWHDLKGRTIELSNVEDKEM